MDKDAGKPPPLDYFTAPPARRKMNVFVLGGSLMAGGLAALLCMHFLIIRPALKPISAMPGYGYGELYGPVYYFRPYLYGACALVVSWGVLLVLKGVARRRSTQA